MLATQLNPIIHNGSLSEYSIVKVKKLQCNNMQVCMDELCTKYVLLAYVLDAIFGNKCFKTMADIFEKLL